MGTLIPRPSKQGLPPRQGAGLEPAVVWTGGLLVGAAWLLSHGCMYSSVMMRLGWSMVPTPIAWLIPLGGMALVLGRWYAGARHRYKSLWLLISLGMVLLGAGYGYRRWMQRTWQHRLQQHTSLWPWSTLLTLWQQGDALGTALLVGSLAHHGEQQTVYRSFCQRPWQKAIPSPETIHDPLQALVLLGQALCDGSDLRHGNILGTHGRFVAWEALLEPSGGSTPQDHDFQGMDGQDALWLAGAWLHHRKQPWPQPWQHLWPQAWSPPCSQLPCTWLDVPLWHHAMDFRHPWPLFARSMVLAEGQISVIPGVLPDRLALALHGLPHQRPTLRMAAAVLPMTRLSAWHWQVRLSPQARFLWYGQSLPQALATEALPLYGAGCGEEVKTQHGWHPLPLSMCLDRWVDVVIPHPQAWQEQPMELVASGQMMLSYGEVELH